MSNTRIWLTALALGMGASACGGEVTQGDRPSRDDDGPPGGSDGSGGSDGGSSGGDSGGSGSDGGGSSGGDSGGGTGDEATRCGDAPVGLDVGDCAPDFTLIDSANDEVALYDLDAAPTLIVGTAAW